MRVRQSQFGVVLITSLVMLIVMTLIGLAAIRLSTVNLRIVNNVQLRQEERSAVQQAIERFINDDFSVTWASGTAVPVSSVPLATYDGREFEVTLKRCMKGVTYVSNSDIFTECYKPGAALSEVDKIGYCACIEKADYEARFGNESQIRIEGVLASGTQTITGSGTAASGIFDPSRCGRVRFNISGSVTDTFSGAWTTINQGVVLLKSETRVKQLREMNSSCPN